MKCILVTKKKLIKADVNPCLCCILLHPTNCADPTSPNVLITLKIVSEDNSSVAITFRVADSNDLMRLNKFVEGLSRCPWDIPSIKISLDNV